MSRARRGRGRPLLRQRRSPDNPVPCAGAPMSWAHPGRSRWPWPRTLLRECYPAAVAAFGDDL